MVPLQSDKSGSMGFLGSTRAKRCTTTDWPSSGGGTSFVRVLSMRFLALAGVAGLEDLEAAMKSSYVFSPGDGTEDDMPILLGEHVCHMSCIP